MTRPRVATLLRLAAGAARYAAHRPNGEQARRRFGARLGRRSQRFLAMLDDAVWRHPESPWRHLLVAAGIEPADVARLVSDEGIDGALEVLARSGVRASAAELRGMVPIQRGSLALAVCAEDFHNPLLIDRSISARTSGSSGRRVAAPYSWELFAEEADAERLLFEAHAAAGDPVALWYPAPPGIAGLHNAILHWRFSRPVTRWFSQTPAARWREAPGLRAMHMAIAAFGTLLGSGAPCHLSLDRAMVVAEWLAEGVRSGERRVLKTFPSSATRVAAAALSAGLDLSGQLVFTGGEPLTVERLALLQSVGLVGLPRYAATELGTAAGACGDPDRAGEMHLYLDRLAVLAGGRSAPKEPAPPINDVLAFTSLTPSAPLVLLNAELGDRGSLRHGACSCALGTAGCSLLVSDVSAPEKFAAEGVKLFAAQLAEKAAGLIVAEGGTADDVQVWWRERDTVPTRLTIVIDPRLRLDTERFERNLLECVGALPGGSLAPQLWRTAGTIHVVRALPRPGPGAKRAPAIEE